MKEILLLKYGEIALKGLNKNSFEQILIKNLKKSLDKFGKFEIYRAQSTIYAEPAEGCECDIDGACEAASKVFGIAALARSIVVEKDAEILAKTAAEYVPPFLEGKKSFKVECKRSDKRFPLNSLQLSALLGSSIYDTVNNVENGVLTGEEKIKVDVNNPDIVVTAEVRDYAAYIHAGTIRGAGGIPVGSGGNGMLLLSGGIDSPVAGYMMAKRGVAIKAVHFESFPYTSELAREKVLRLAEIMEERCGEINVTVVSLTKIQEAIAAACNEEYFTLLLRRSMMRIAEKTARYYKCGALITGESLGQVASQTMAALGVTNAVVKLPVLRPCIGMDKEEIVTTARKIGTFETSIEPYEDCCTVFTPRHPKTNPDIEKVMAEEEKYDYAALEEEAFRDAVKKSADKNNN